MLLLYSPSLILNKLINDFPVIEAYIVSLATMTIINDAAIDKTFLIFSFFTFILFLFSSLTFLFMNSSKILLILSGTDSFILNISLLWFKYNI